MLGLADVAAAADGVGPLSEQVRLHLKYGGDHATRDLLLRRGDALAGYSHLGGPDPAGHLSGELVIHPARASRPAQVSRRARCTWSACIPPSRAPDLARR